MNWEQHIKDLEDGKNVSFRPKGNSMKPKVCSGDLVTISPEISVIKKGDIIFCKVKSNYYIHLVKSVGKKGYLIGNNHGKINGWTHKVYGKVIKVEK